MKNKSNIFKIIAGIMGCFLLIIGATFKFWYGPNDLSLSFFLNGKGEPYIDIAYSDDSDEDSVISVYPQLDGQPVLQEIKINTSEIKNINLTVKHYSGSLHISDVFLQGKHLTDMHPIDDSLHIINNSPNNISFNVTEKAQIELCNDCYPQNTSVFKPFRFGIVIGAYLGILLIALICFLMREKIKQKMLSIYSLKNYSLILPYAKPYWFRAILAIAITIPVGSMDAVIAWSLKPFMDVVLVEQQTGWTSYIPLMIITFSILQAVFTYIATYMNTWVGNRIALDIKGKLFDKLVHNDASFFDKTDSGMVLMRFNRDAEMACGGLLNSMRLFSTRFFSSISLIIVLFYNSWKLAVVAIAVLILTFYPVTQLRKKMKFAVKQDVNFIAALYAHFNEIFGGNRIVSAYNLSSLYKKKFINTTNGMLNMLMFMMKKIGVVAPLMHVISASGIALVIWYGSYLIVQHQITVGNFVSFITSLVMLYNPLKSIGSNISSVILSLMAVERVFQTLNYKPKVLNAENPVFLENCKGNISFKDVTFSYVKGKYVLNHINLNIKAGQTVALVGNSGGGKSTIAMLLPRFYDIHHGEIIIDGINIKDIDLNNLRKNIAVVFQDNFLFGGTIRENIIFNRKDVSEEQLNKAIKSACLEEFINSLDNGLDTQIGERGVMLSGGQKQRIAIARAFIKNAPILILDEATSALDNKSEAVVQQAIDNLMKDRTVLVIAHRLSTIRNADYIAVVNNGRIVERGSHKKLLANEGEYAALYKTQLI